MSLHQKSNFPPPGMYCNHPLLPGVATHKGRCIHHIAACSCSRCWDGRSTNPWVLPLSSQMWITDALRRFDPNFLARSRQRSHALASIRLSASSTQHQGWRLLRMRCCVLQQGRNSAGAAATVRCRSVGHALEPLAVLVQAVVGGGSSTINSPTVCNDWP